eukprot:9289789-Alexandrium_andersonii.AAC.1
MHTCPLKKCAAARHPSPARTPADKWPTIPNPVASLRLGHTPTVNVSDRAWAWEGQFEPMAQPWA